MRLHRIFTPREEARQQAVLNGLHGPAEHRVRSIDNLVRELTSLAIRDHKDGKLWEYVPRRGKTKARQEVPTVVRETIVACVERLAINATKTPTDLFLNPSFSIGCFEADTWVPEGGGVGENEVIDEGGVTAEVFSEVFVELQKGFTVAGIPAWSIGSDEETCSPMLDEALPADPTARAKVRSSRRDPFPHDALNLTLLSTLTTPCYR